MRFDGYEYRLMFWMIAPAALVAVVLAGCCAVLALRRSLSCLNLAQLSLPLLLRLLFLLFPIITNAAFEAFSCYEFADSTAFLVADVSIQCSYPWYGQQTYDEHLRVTALALVAVAIYPVGLILLNGVLLFKARKAIRSGKPSVLSQATAFLHREYETSTFWWEVVEVRCAARMRDRSLQWVAAGCVTGC
jgi:hypothetical protein